jgi:hypothetical protein
MLLTGKPLCRTDWGKLLRLLRSLSYCLEQGRSSGLPLGDLKDFEEWG